MSWEALGALASFASAIIVLVAAIAAVRQLRHMRLANQLHSYHEIMAWMQSAESLEARRFLNSLDLSDPATLLAVTTPVVDQRLAALGAHYQNVARLLNLGVLDEVLFALYYDMTPRIWPQLQPVAAVMRERTGSPIWIDIEYLVYRGHKKQIVQRVLRRYPADFARNAKLTYAVSTPGSGRRESEPSDRDESVGFSPP
ncbi:MAG TPA: hypothetical protein VHZ01_03705 [Casimicrobiaceae bacterium]|jgi:hypothetical protein|nr:hypothetical protein [Casimicrobiaceae bacterium]